jgi:prepilin signal peptidase PulO-like enzyme (type II secretory pathway)
VSYRPVHGWLDTFSFAHLLTSGSYDQSEMGAIVGPVLIGVAVVLLAAAVAALRVRTPLDGVLLGLVLVMSTLDYQTLAYPHELVRNPSVALLVALAVLLTRPRPETVGAPP